MLYRRRGKSRDTPLARWLNFLLAACIIALLSAYAVSTSYHKRLSILRFRTRRIALALEQYHEHYGTLPPKYVVDEEGRPLYSWRVLILPFLDNAPDSRDIYEAFDLSAPWNSPHNLEVAQRLRYFGVSAAAPCDHCTAVYAVVGDGTVWESVEASDLKSIADGAANTLLIVSATGPEALWTAPVDIRAEQLLDQSSESSVELHHLMFCSAHGMHDWHPEDRRYLKAILSASGSEFADTLRFQEKVLSTADDPGLRMNAIDGLRQLATQYPQARGDIAEVIAIGEHDEDDVVRATAREAIERLADEDGRNAK